MSTWARFVALVALASAVLVGCGGKPPRSLHEAEGGFSYDPPADWTVQEFPGLKYRIAVGPVEAEFAPNINVADEAFAGSLSDYVAGNLSAMERIFEDPRVVKREEFQTADLSPSTRVVMEDEQQGRELRQTFYFFEGKDRKYVATCTALADGGEAWDAVFETSMKSFRVH